MSRIFVPTTNAEDWSMFLAAPERHWRTGFSAKTLAYSWQTANGFPPEVLHLFRSSGIDALQSIELLFAFPEYKVALPGGGAASQNDLLVIGKARDGNLAIITVEGKVRESFDVTVARWLTHASSGKQQRLAFLKHHLGITDVPIDHIRYQLLHRTVAAIVEAERLNARYAISLIHSFSQTDQWFKDYQAFVGLFDQHIQPNQLLLLRDTPTIAIYTGWVRGDPIYLAK